MMKKLIIGISILLVSFGASSRVLDNTNTEVLVDNTVYERVFNTCIDAFKTLQTKPEEKPSDTINACDKTARKIASRSEYVSTDDRYYITITPIVPNKDTVQVVPIESNKK